MYDGMGFTTARRRRRRERRASEEPRSAPITDPVASVPVDTTPSPSNGNGITQAQPTIPAAAPVDETLPPPTTRKLNPWLIAGAAGIALLLAR